MTPPLLHQTRLLERMPVDGRQQTLTNYTNNNEEEVEYVPPTYTGGVCCLLCNGDHTELTSARQMQRHIMTTHKDHVNRILDSLEPTGYYTTQEPDTNDSDSLFNNLDDTDNDTTTPVLEADDTPEHNGMQLNPNNPRVCDDCGQQMSKSYANVFATNQGTLYCPDCRSRTERYSTPQP